MVTEEQKQLFESNITYAKRLAWKYWKKHGAVAVQFVGYDDLVQVSMIALWRAAKAYRCEQGKAKFSTYAYWAIWRSMTDEVAKGGVIHMPRGQVRRNDIYKDEAAEKCRYSTNLTIDIRDETDDEVEPLSEELKTALGVIEKLSPKDREIIECSFGLNGQASMNYSEISRKIGRTSSAVRQKVGRILRQIHIQHERTNRGALCQI